MAAENEFKVIFGADGKPLEKTINQLEADLKRFNKELETTAGARGIADLNKKILETRKNMDILRKFGTNAFSGLTPSANAATFALTDVSRIAQDIPYGLQGIQNNIPTLIESFGRLKRETGGTGAALKALGSSLLGVGGLGFAVSAVLSAVQIYNNGITTFGRKTKEAKDEYEEFLKALRSTSEIAGDATGSVEAELVKVQTLSAAIKDVNKSNAERKTALEDLKRINKEYFGDLSLEASSLATLTTATDEYTKALINQAIAKGFADELSKVAVELNKQEGILQRLKSQYNALGAVTKQEVAKAASWGASVQDVSKTWEKGSAEKAMLEQINVVDKLRGDLLDLKTNYTAALTEGLKFKSLTASTPNKTTEDKELKNLKQDLDGVEKQLKVINDLRKEGILPKFREDDATALELKVLELLEKIDKREVEIKIKPKLDIDPQLNELQIQRIEKEGNERLAFTKFQAPLNLIIDTRKLISQTQASVNETLRRAGFQEVKSPAITLTGSLSPEFNDDMLEKLNTAGRNAGEAYTLGLKLALGQKLATVLQQGALDAFTVLGESLGNIFSQDGGLAVAAQSFLRLIGDVLQQIGKQIIIASKAMAAVNAAIQAMFANPATGAIAGVAAGIGLIAVGQLLKNIKFSSTKLAEGGVVMGPTTALIGEAGPEMVIPLSRANSIMDGGSTGFVAETAIRGQDLAVIIRRAVAAEMRKR
jgi:hypothetical protein